MDFHTKSYKSPDPEVPIQNLCICINRVTQTVSLGCLWFTLAAFTKPSQETLMDVYWYWMKDWESLGCWTKPLARYISEIEKIRTVEENIIHYKWFVRASFSFISLENVFGASSFSRLTGDSSKKEKFTRLLNPKKNIMINVSVVSK